MAARNADTAFIEIVADKNLLIVFIHFVLNKNLRNKDIHESLDIESSLLSKHIAYLTTAGIIEARGTEKSLTAFGKEVGTVFNQTYIFLKAKAKAVLAQTSCYSGYVIKRIGIRDQLNSGMPSWGVQATIQPMRASNLIMDDDSPSKANASLINDRYLPENLSSSLSPLERQLIAENVQQHVKTSGNYFRRRHGT